jgi:gluconate:H+ symporter, GntP family
MAQIIVLVLSIIFIIVVSSRFKIHPFLTLIFAALLYGFFTGMPLNTIVDSINQGFGTTIGQIGIIIILGTIIGGFLEHSGGAYSLAEKILKIIGQKRVPGAMSIIGYIVSIPVFADSGFVILSPLNKALTKRAKTSLAGTSIALGIGLMVSHNLVPPTPGPIAAAGILEADLGLVLLIGIPTSLLVLFCTWLFATKIASRVWIDPNPELSDENIARRIETAPGATHSILPIVVPIILIVLRSVASLPSLPFGENNFQAAILFLGQPLIALLFGTCLSFTLPKNLELKVFSTEGWVGKALINAAIIIMITGAGGSFGKVLQNSDIANTIGESLAHARLGIWLPFIIAAAIKTAQGSSTVALITTASLLSPLLVSLGFDSQIARALFVLAIGSGSMVASHANDSFFWVVTQMSNMDIKVGYKLHTVGSIVAGVSAAMFVWILALILL